MTKGDEIGPIYAWLDGLLRGDAQLAAAATGGFWGELADESAGYPHVLTTKTSQPRHLAAIGAGAPVWLEGTYIVKMVGRGRDLAALQPGAARIVVLLSETRGTTGSGRFWSSREGAWERVYTEDRIEYRELGAEFRIRCQLI